MSPGLLSLSKFPVGVSFSGWGVMFNGIWLFIVSLLFFLEWSLGFWGINFDDCWLCSTEILLFAIVFIFVKSILLLGLLFWLIWVFWSFWSFWLSSFFCDISDFLSFSVSFFLRFSFIFSLFCFCTSWEFWGVFGELGNSFSGFFGIDSSGLLFCIFFSDFLFSGSFGIFSSGELLFIFLLSSGGFWVIWGIGISLFLFSSIGSFGFNIGEEFSFSFFNATIWFSDSLFSFCCCCITTDSFSIAWFCDRHLSIKTP